MPDSTIGHNRLKSFVQRVERLREEIDALNKDVSEVYKEAKGEGWNVQAIKALIAERSRHARNPEKFRELNDFVELYRSALESGTVVATRARVNLNSNPHTSTPEATVKGEADGTLPRTASPAVPRAESRRTDDQRVETSFAGTEGDADRQPNSNPATSSPPETGDDAASSSLASSPNNSPAALLSAGEGTHPTDDKERGDAVRGKGSPDGEVYMAVKSPHGAHESDDFDPVRDMPAHLRR